jgi:hypothetical protein
MRSFYAEHGPESKEILTHLRDERQERLVAKHDLSRRQLEPPNQGV